MTNRGNRFLEIEEAAAELLAHLDGLREETEKNAKKALEYGTASSQLSAVSDLLADELSGYEETSKKLLELINKMSSVGIPELLASVEKNQEHFESTFEQFKHDVKELGESTNAAINSTIAELTASNSKDREELKAILDQFKIEAKESGEKTNNALAELLKSNEKSTKNIEEEVNKLLREFKESEEKTSKAAASIMESGEKTSRLVTELNSSNAQSQEEITREFSRLRLETDMVKSGLSRHITIGVLINSAVVIAGCTLVMILT